MRLPIQASQVISIQLPDAEGQPRYLVRVVDFTEDYELILYAPFEEVADEANQGEETEATEQEQDEQKAAQKKPERREVSVESGTPVVVELLLPDGIRRFTSLVRRRLPMSPPALSLEWPREVQRIQRRGDVRVEADLKVELQLPANPGQRPERIQAVTSDLSAGGIRVLTPEPLEPDLSVRLRLQLPGGVLISCSARTVRGGENAGATSSKHKYWTGVQFSDISERDRRTITQAVFEIQRELLRRS